MRLLIFLGVVALVVGSVHRWLWMRLVRDADWPAPWRGAATWALVLLALSIPTAILFSRSLPRPAAAPLAWVGYCWLGLMFYLVVVLTPVEPVRAVVRWSRRGDPVDVSRRAFLARVVGLSTLAAAGGLAGAAAVVAGRRVAVKRVTIGVRGLDPRLAGFRIVQISDTHLGPTLREDFVREVVATANGLDADLVALTGDMVDGSVPDLRDVVAPFADLRSREGTFLVTGNHEHYAGADVWVRHFERIGVRALRNAHVVVGADRGGLTLAGVDDYAGRADDPPGGPDMARAVAGAEPSRPIVLLAHQPKAVEDAQRAGVAVQLSGHTHGGQLWPFGLLVALVQPAVAGLHAFGETTLYVSCGTGYWGPPMRLGAPPEVTLVELVPAA